ncbi:hypothetical protein BJY59DRAFT_293217 [Rhodotorula toruloides]
MGASVRSLRAWREVCGRRPGEVRGRARGRGCAGVLQEPPRRAAARRRARMRRARARASRARGRAVVGREHGVRVRAVECAPPAASPLLAEVALLFLLPLPLPLAAAAGPSHLALLPHGARGDGRRSVEGGLGARRARRRRDRTRRRGAPARLLLLPSLRPPRPRPRLRLLVLLGHLLLLVLLVLFVLLVLLLLLVLWLRRGERRRHPPAAVGEPLRRLGALGLFPPLLLALALRLLLHEQLLRLRHPAPLLLALAALRRREGAERRKLGERAGGRAQR